MGNKILTQKRAAKLSAETVVIPEGYTHIGESAFDYTQVVRVICPEGLRIIRDKAFMFCFNLKEIIIPKTVTKIGAYAFFNCDNLKHLTLSENIHNIGSLTFSGCDDLVIKAPVGSYAIKYAKENGIEHEEI